MKGLQALRLQRQISTIHHRRSLQSSYFSQEWVLQLSFVMAVRFLAVEVSNACNDMHNAAVMRHATAGVLRCAAAFLGAL